MRSRPASLSERFYRMLLRLYPGEFRREYAEQLRVQFCDELRDESSSRGGLGPVFLWLKTVPDLLASMAREWGADLAPDLRHGLRRLRTQPISTIMTTVTITLAVGVITATFGVIEVVLLRPLPFPHPDRLVRLTTIDPALGSERATRSEFTRWGQQTLLFSDTVAYMASTVNLTGGREAARAVCASVTQGFFRAFGTYPAKGRTFREEDRQRYGNHVVILSNAVWQRVFRGDPAILGKVATIDGQDLVVIGIMPPNFRFLNEEVDLWRPLALEGRGSQVVALLTVFARLRPDVTLRRATADLQIVQKQISEEDPLAIGYQPRAMPINEELARPVRRGLVALMAAGMFVFLIACVNVASLQHACHAGRTNELAIRTALGASKSRLVRQLATESLLLAGIGGTLGLGMCWWATGAIWASAPESITRFPKPAIDATLLAFGAIALVMVVIFAGVLPAVVLSGTELSRAMKTGFTSLARVQSRILGRDLLVVPQIALSMALA